MRSWLQAEGSRVGLPKIAGRSASDVIDPSRCGRRSTPGVQRGRAQEDESSLLRECTINRRIWYHTDAQRHREKRAVLCVSVPLYETPAGLDTSNESCRFGTSSG